MTSTDIDLIALGVTGNEMKFLRKRAQLQRKDVIQWMSDKVLYGTPPQSTRALDYVEIKRGVVPVKWLAALRDLVIKRLGVATWEGLITALTERRRQRGTI